jgi:hypothetical protein
VQMNVRLPQQDEPGQIEHRLRVTAGGRTGSTSVYIRPL